MAQPPHRNGRMRQPRVRVSATTHARLTELAEARGLSMTEVLDRAVEAYRRQWFFDQANEGYARLRSDPTAWDAWQAELAAWGVTLMDGMSDEPASDVEGGGPPYDLEIAPRIVLSAAVGSGVLDIDP